MKDELYVILLLLAMTTIVSLIGMITGQIRLANILYDKEQHCIINNNEK